jgi:hypothetical protein
MSVPQIQIFSNILTSPIADAFILDSATFGVLDTDVLGGFVEVPLDVPIRSMTISRGRSRQLDRYTAGTASIVFNNFDRRLDPLNEDSDLFGQIVPRQRLKVLADGINIFTGVVSDWDIDYDITNLDFAVASAADAFTVLANFVFGDAVTPVQESPAQRLEWVLEEFDYKGDSNFLGGPSTLGAYQVDSGTQALDYMFSVARSAQSSFFVSADGVLELIGIFDKVPTSAVTFSDDGSGVPYLTLQNQYGDELLYNRVVASSPAGLAVVEDSASIAQFEVSTLDLSGLLLNSTVQLVAVANSYLNLYSVPQVRFTGLSVELAGLSVEDTNAILRLDLTDQVTVVKSFDVGSPLQVSQDLMITGIRHQIRPDSYVVEFSFDPSEFREAFKLDDAVYGILDGNYVLG